MQDFPKKPPALAEAGDTLLSLLSGPFALPSPSPGSRKSAIDPKRNAPASFRTPGRSQFKASRADAQPLYWL